VSRVALVVVVMSVNVNVNVLSFVMVILRHYFLVSVVIEVLIPGITCNTDNAKGDRTA
jgi:hypothetical protein